MKRTIAALSTAVLLSLCFPSGWLWPLAWIALVPLISSVDQDVPGRAFWRGYAAGWLFFLLTLFWIHHVTFIGLFLLAGYLALYWGVFAMAAAWSFPWPLWRRTVFLASLWVGLEYIRAHAFTGFGWSALAHTQAANILLIQIVDVTGTYGIAWVMAGFAVLMASLAGAVLRREKVAVDVRPVALGIAALLACLSVYGVWRLNGVPRTAPVRAALIQANISLAEHWDPLLKPFIVDEYLALSRQAMAQKPQLIIWPETSFPSFVWEHPALFEKVSAFARENKVRVLLGLVTRDKEKYFNSAVLVDEQGRLAGRYNKQHLVVFGEYIPFRQRFPFLAKFVPIDDFTAGRGNTLFLDGQGRSFSVLICFEDTLPGLARQAVREGAGFLVNMTNDAWFGASRQPRMHLDNAVFRSVENRTPLVRATNTGMSCGVTPTGEAYGCVADVQGRSVMAQGISVLDIPPATAPLTFYTKYGDVFAMLCFLGILGAGFVGREKQEAGDV